MGMSAVSVFNRAFTRHVELWFAKGEDDAQIMEAFHAQSKNLQNAEWLKDWEVLCEEK